MLPLILLLIFILVFASAIFSMLETAFLSVSENFIVLSIKNKIKNFECLQEVRNNIDIAIVTIVLLNNLNNIGGSIFVGYLAALSFNSLFVGVIAFILTGFIVVVGEIIPKNIGLVHAEKIVLFSCKYVLFFTKLLSPITRVFHKIIKKPMRPRVKESDLLILSEISEEQGEISNKEKHLLQNLFKLNDLTAGEIMTPRSVVTFISIGESIFDTVQLVSSFPHSRFPIYDNVNETVIGIVIKNILYAKYIYMPKKVAKNTSVTEVSQEALFVLTTDKIDDIFSTLQKQKKHIAIVVDEFKTMVGIITIEDILEQIVGQIVDETDVDRDLRETALKTLK